MKFSVDRQQAYTFLENDQFFNRQCPMLLCVHLIAIIRNLTIPYQEQVKVQVELRVSTISDQDYNTRNMLSVEVNSPSCQYSYCSEGRFANPIKIVVDKYPNGSRMLIIA